MKPIRTILIFLVVIALLGVGFYFVMQYDPQAERPAETGSQLYMYKTDVQNIAALSITNPNGSYYLQKIDGLWVANSDPAIGISQDKVKTLAYQAANISAVQLIEENAVDVSPYRLDKPRRSITITLQDGKDIVVVIGSATEDSALCYAMINGENKIYTKLSATCDNLIPSLDELFDNVLYSMTKEDIGTITMEKAGARVISLEKQPADSVDGKTTFEWQMLLPLKKTANEFTISEILLNSMNIMTASRVIPKPEHDKDYGFTAPKARFSVKNTDGTKVYTILVGNENSGKCYVKLDDASTTIYEIPKSNLAFLDYHYLEFVDKTIHIENIQDVTKVHLTGLGKDYEMTISEANKGYSINGKTIPEQTFKTIYQTMVGITMDDFTQSSPDGEAVNFSIRYQKASGGENKVEFLTYDDRNYRVTINGEGNLLIRKKQLENLITLIDKTLAN